MTVTVTRRVSPMDRPVQSLAVPVVPGIGVELEWSDFVSRLAAFFLPFLPQTVFDQTMAMSLHLFVISTQVPGVPEGMPFGVALVLITMVLAMNAISIAFRIYLRGKKKW